MSDKEDEQDGSKTEEQLKDLRPNQVAYQTGAQNGQSFVTFSRSISFLGMTPEESVKLGQQLIINGHTAQAQIEIVLANEQGQANIATKH